jgi:hypothetical protein
MDRMGSRWYRSSAEPGQGISHRRGGLRGRVLTISEVDGGNVPEVAAVNSAEVPILLLDGEHIEGAMQNRVLNSTVLMLRNRRPSCRSPASSTVAGIRKRA